MSNDIVERLLKLAHEGKLTAPEDVAKVERKREWERKPMSERETASECVGERGRERARGREREREREREKRERERERKE